MQRSSNWNSSMSQAVNISFHPSRKHHELWQIFCVYTWPVLCMVCRYLAQKLVCLMSLLVIALFSTTALLSSFMFHDHPHRKVFVGSVGLVASIAMYSSPLVAVKLVVKTKSVEFMPFYLSFFSFLASSLWMAYGLLGQEFFIAAPNFLGAPMGLLQLGLYCIYRKNKGGVEQFKGMDVEKSEAKPITP